MPALYCQKNCTCHRHNWRGLTKEHKLIRESYNTYKYNASKKFRIFELSPAQFYEVITKDCYYCGQKPEKRTTRRYKIAMNGIDRVDSTKGYVVDNIVTCCHSCNLMKGKLPKVDFISHIKKIAEHLK
jgi:hypothetical protein